MARLAASRKEINHTSSASSWWMVPSTKPSTNAPAKSSSRTISAKVKSIGSPGYAPIRPAA